MHEFPARYLVQFFKNHGMLSVDRPSDLARGQGRIAALRWKDWSRRFGIAFI